MYISPSLLDPDNAGVRKETIMSNNLTKKLVFSAMAIALALVTSRIRLFKMPMGGSITPFSMLFVTLIGYWFGLKHGLTAAVAYGLLRVLISDSGNVSIVQVLMDYPLAFGALGLSGFFKDHKWGLYTGYIVGVCGRFIFSTLSGILFFAQYAPEGMSAWRYSASYNGGYMAAEAVMTLILLAIPVVSKGLKRVGEMAK